MKQEDIIRMAQEAGLVGGPVYASMNEEERKIWNDAIDAVLELLRTRPPHRMGEAEFMRRLLALKLQKKK